MKLKSIKLKNFRQFKEIELDTDADLVLIQGDNTSGKSTILEAISILTNMDSPFASHSSDIPNDTVNDESFYISAQIEAEDGIVREYSVYQEVKGRQFKIDGKRVSKRKYRDSVGSILFSPEQIETLMLSPQKRRDTLDAFIKQTDLNFAQQLQKAKSTLKQRNSYLKKLAKTFYESGFISETDKQLEYWSDLHSKFSTRIVETRMVFIEKLQHEELQVSYLNSALEKIEDEDDISDPESLQKISNLRNRKKDIALGYTNSGFHRDDWELITDKDIRRKGSRGEKRLAITKLLLQIHQVILDEINLNPLLLLDDIASELDDQNISKIVSDEAISKQQTFITAIRLEDLPKDIRRKAAVIRL